MNAGRKFLIALGAACLLVAAGSIIAIGFSINKVSGLAAIVIVTFWIGRAVFTALNEEAP